MFSDDDNLLPISVIHCDVCDVIRNATSSLVKLSQLNEATSSDVKNDDIYLFVDSMFFLSISLDATQSISLGDATAVVL
jgi:hypothetical protein